MTDLVIENARQEFAFRSVTHLSFKSDLAQRGSPNKYRGLVRKITRCHPIPDMVGTSADLLLAECIRRRRSTPRKEFRGTHVMTRLASRVRHEVAKAFYKNHGKSALKDIVVFNSDEKFQWRCHQQSIAI
jgi:hypothetical protein